MHKEIYNLIRGTLLIVLILFFVVLCVTEHRTPYPAYTETTCIEPTTASSEPSNPLETEAPTETAPPETEPTRSTEPPTEPPTEPESSETWESLGTFTLTAYCSCSKCCGKYGVNRPTDETGEPIVYTSIGEIAKAGTTIAVDPSVIPYGSEVKIDDHVYIAQDTGGSMNGSRIDIYFDDHQEALEFGRQKAEVFLKTVRP